MGFWERNVSNSIDSIFDLNRNGSLDAAEQALQYEVIMGHSDDDEDDKDEDDG